MFDEGSITGELLVNFVSLLNKAAWSHSAQKASILLVLGDYASRKSAKWLNECVENNTEAVVNAASTPIFYNSVINILTNDFKNCAGNSVMSSFIKETLA